MVLAYAAILQHAVAALSEARLLRQDAPPEQTEPLDQLVARLEVVVDQLVELTGLREQKGL